MLTEIHMGIQEELQRGAKPPPKGSDASHPEAGTRTQTSMGASSPVPQPAPVRRESTLRCERCWQQPEKWVEAPSEYNDRVRVSCRECGKFIGYRLLESDREKQKQKRA